MEEKKNMKKTWVFIVLILFLVSSYGTYAILMFSKGAPTQTTTVTTSLEMKDKILIFHSAECPHCKQLIEDFKTKKIEEKITNVQWMLLDDKDMESYNVQLYISKVQECKLGNDSYVVPFAYHNGQCYIGNDKILEYVNELMGTTTTTTK